MKKKAIEAIKESKPFKLAFLLIFPLFARPLHFSDKKCSQYSNNKWLWTAPLIATIVFNILSNKVIFDTLLVMAGHASSPEQATKFIASMMWKSKVACWMINISLIFLIIAFAAFSFYKNRAFYILFKKLNFEVESIKFKYFFVHYSSVLFILSVFSYVVYVIQSGGAEKYISLLSQGKIFFILIFFAGLHFWANRNNSMGMKAVYKKCYFWVVMLNLALLIGILISTRLLIAVMV